MPKALNQKQIFLAVEMLFKLINSNVDSQTVPRQMRVNNLPTSAIDISEWCKSLCCRLRLNG